MAVDFLQFMFQFIIAGFVVRYAQVWLTAHGYTDFGKALAFIH